MSRYFSPETDPLLFRCPCGRAECDAPLIVSPRLLTKLDLIRELFGSPLRITSGNRCAVHNAAVGGEPISEHVIATGAEGCDIACETSRIRHRLIRAYVRAGIDRNGIYLQHLHVGVGLPPRFPQGVTWYGTTA